MVRLGAILVSLVPLIWAGQSFAAQYADLDCGKPIGELNTIQAKSNASDTNTEEDCGDELKAPDQPYDISSIYGDPFQCVEYIKHYYNEIYHMPTGTWAIDKAVDYYNKAATLGLDKFSNGSSAPPQEGDIIVFVGPSDTAGHVAIVRSVSITPEVSKDRVLIIEQNWNREIGYGELRRRSGGNWDLYRVLNNGKESGYTIVGWLRKPNTTPPPSDNGVLISGSLDGLANGQSITLQNKSGDDITLSNNVSFFFPTEIASGQPYNVTIKSQPDGQYCTVAKGSGVVNGAVTDVTVTCSSTVTIGGTISGLSPGTQVVLQNGTDLVTLNSDGPFSFTVPVGSSYSISVNAPPNGENCAVQLGSSPNATAPVSNIFVTCARIFNVAEQPITHNSTYWVVPYRTDQGYDSFQVHYWNGTADGGIACESTIPYGIGQYPTEIVSGSIVLGQENLPAGGLVDHCVTYSNGDVFQIIVFNAHEGNPETTAHYDVSYYQVVNGMPASLPPTKVTVGSEHVCALVLNGTVKCWGDNTFGEIGKGVASDSDYCYSKPCGKLPFTAIGVNHVIDVSAAAGSTCALLSNHTVQCWGASGYGGLGNGSFGEDSCDLSPSTATVPIPCNLKPVAVSGINNAVSLGNGNSNTICAVLSDGQIACWGLNEYGNLGGGFVGPAVCEDNRICSSSPVYVSGINNAIAVAAGYTHACALLSDHTVKCWGSSLVGQLGNGTVSERGSLLPVSVPSLNGVIAISAGGGNTCALLSDHSVKCWGDNSAGQLGSDGPDQSGDCYQRNGISPCSATPITISGLSNVAEVSVGGVHICARLIDGHIECWGTNAYGELGVGYFGNYSAVPLTVVNIDNAKYLSAGMSTCTITTDNHLKCWGINFDGELGDGVPIYSPTLVPISGF